MKPRNQKVKRFKLKKDKFTPVRLTKTRALNSNMTLVDLFDGRRHQEIVLVND